MEHGTGHPSPTTGPTRQPLARPATRQPLAPSSTAKLLANSRAPRWSEGEQGTGRAEEHAPSPPTRAQE